MKAEELRMGNWVFLYKGNDKVPFQMEGFDIYKVSESNCYYISPIPLTEKVLEACGAVYLHANIWEYELKLSAINVYFRFNSNHCFSEVGGIYMGDRISHLHQLQNLYYAMRGAELQIDLEKLKEAL